MRAAGIILINQPEAIALAQDKLMSGVYLHQHRLPIPATQSINSSGAIDFCKKNFPFPLILKKPIGKRGSSVMKCHDAELFEDSVHMSGLQNGTLLAQHFVKSSYGRDLRVFVIGGEAIACMQRIAKKGGYKSNFSMGGHVESHEISNTIRDISLRAADAIGLDIAGVDLLFDSQEDSFTVCEVNSAPGFKGLEQATGINVAGKIIDYVLQRHHDRARSKA
jgi:gamma-F420-2:alpha-L-glutamate ligase